MIALVPFKGFRNGKSRLASALDEAERARLGMWMLERVLSALGQSSSVDRVLLVCRDGDARSAAAARGAETLAEESENLNGALREGIAYLEGGLPGPVELKRGALSETKGRADRRMIVIPADLPLLAPEDVDRMAEMCGEAAPCVVAAPSRREEGTNALLLCPVGILTPSFGPDSFRRHHAQAEGRGVGFEVYRSPGVGLDIDLPEDLESLRRALGEEASRALSAFLKTGSSEPP